ncbi:MAG: type IX secretion system membrane protein PorP/SprF [Bacteroidetes bacterium]|nr:type IX secretion system membrane protein PorP/SprF [Bacteroidota bacterium]
MKTLTKIVLVLVLTTWMFNIRAQQLPMYTHYMYNTLVVNPAYAGSRDALTVTALHRSQWVGFAGAPSTQTLTLHSPLRNEHIGLGLSISNDKIGPTNTTSALIDFAYIMQLTAKSRLALGISGGINVFQADLSTLLLEQQNDPVFKTDISNNVTPNFGFGAYYSRERFYAGLSIPYLLENNYSKVTEGNGNQLIAKEQRHYFFIMGTLLPISDNLAFKPTTLIKITNAAPVQADVTASFIIMKTLLVGAMIRTGDAVGILVGLDITDQLHLGYSFDWSYGLETSRYNNGSHELVLRYDFIFPSKKQIHSPRNF